MTDMTSAAPHMRPPQLPMTPVQGKIDVGALWTATFRVVGQAPKMFFALSFLPLVFGLPAALVQPQGPTGQGSHTGIWILLLIGQIILQGIVNAAMIYGSGRILAGGSCTAPEAMRGGLRRFVPYFFTGLLITLAIFLGFILLIVPGLIAAIALSLAPQASIIEELGPVESVKRSNVLTKGNRWRIVGAFLLVIGVPTIGLSIVFGIVAIVFVLLNLHLLATLSTVLEGPLVLPLVVALSTLIFFHLRAFKEGVLPNASVAQVFD